MSSRLSEGSYQIRLSEGSCQMMSVALGQWHRLEALEPGTAIFESNDGAYVPLGPEDVMEDPLMRPMLAIEK